MHNETSLRAVSSILTTLDYKYSILSPYLCFTKKKNKYLWGNKTISPQEVNRFLIKIRRLTVEQNKIVHIHFANGEE